jgi:hypothetical protein
MAKGRKKPPAKMLYQHSPNVVEKFGGDDVYVNDYPVPGIDFHSNEQLARWVEKYGVAPDVLFRQGLAAPPLGKNASGLRHYSAEFVGDPGMILNLDVPINSQTRAVQDALDRIGIRRGILPDDVLGITGEPMSTQELLWLNAMRNHGGFGNTKLSDLDPTVDPSLEGPNAMRNIAEWAASGDPAADAIRNELSPIIIDRLVEDARIPAASRMGTGWGAGTAYGPQSLGKSPMKMLEDEAASARADGDILRAQEIENQLHEGTIPEKGVNLPAPNGGTREYKVFDENAVNIKRIASLLGAMGLGGSVASADDRYGDRVSKFSTPPAPPPASQNEPDNSFMGMAGRAAKYVGDRFSDDLNPEDMAAFQAKPTREMRHFNAVVDEAMQMPVVRVKDGGGTVHTITPARYFELAKKSGIVSEESVNNALASIKGMPFDQNDKTAIALRDGFLNQMRSNLPGRYEPGATDTEFDAGATPEQAAEFDKVGPAESRYRLTPQGEQGYQSERAYNLFSTFQNGTHRPIGANNSGKALAAVGGLALDMVGDTKGAAQTYNLAANRFNTPQGRMNEALQWWYTGQPNGTAGDSLGGAKYPSLSSTTFEGATTKMANADNFLPRYNQQLSERYLYNLDMPEANRVTLDRMRDDFYRTTPRYPAGADPKQARGIIRELKDLDTEARQYSSVEYPSFVKKYSMSPEAFGGATHDFTGKTVMPDKPMTPVKPTYLSPFGEMIANYPRDLADMQTIGELGLAGVTGGGSLIGSLINEKSMARGGAKVAKSLARGGARVGGESLGETPQNAAIMQVNLPDQHPGLFTPPEYHPLVTDFGGDPVRADDPNYEMYKPSAYQKRDDRLRRILEAGTTMYGLPPARMAPAQRYTSPMAQ